MAYPHESLTRHPHDRLGVLRKDDDALARRWEDPASRVLVVSGNRVRPRDGAVDWVPTSEVPDGVRVLLGERDGTTWWAVLTSSDLGRSEPGEWVDLREALPLLDGEVGDDAALVLHALGLAEWHAVTRHCARCGGTLVPRAAGHELTCESCGRHWFPRLDPAVIMLVAAGEPWADDERCLLGRHPQWPAGRYSTLAGFCEPGERLEDTVRREVMEESGIEVGEVTYFGNQPWPLPSSLMLGFLARAGSEEIHLHDHELEDARWFTREEMRSGTASGDLVLPGGVSISRSLVEHWYGGTLPGQW